MTQTQHKNGGHQCNGVPAAKLMVNLCFFYFYEVTSLPGQKVAKGVDVTLPARLSSAGTPANTRKTPGTRYYHLLENPKVDLGQAQLVLVETLPTFCTQFARKRGS